MILKTKQNKQTIRERCERGHLHPSQQAIPQQGQGPMQDA